MNTRVLVSLALLVGIGAVLHAVIPGIFFGMKPDMMLTMMFLAILMFPNVIDKIITAFIFFAFVLLLKKYSQTLVSAAILTAVGTVVSGTIFLTAALLLVELPGGAAFSGLFLAVVLPAAVINTIVMVIIYPIASSIFKRMNITAHA